MSNNVTWPPIPRKIGNEDLPDASDDPYMQPDGVDTTELTSWMLKHSGPFLSSWVAKHFRDNPNAVPQRLIKLRASQSRQDLLYSPDTKQAAKAIWIYVYGNINPRPCKPCSDGESRFEECVSLGDVAGCANCYREQKANNCMRRRGVLGSKGGKRRKRAQVQ